MYLNTEFSQQEIDIQLPGKRELYLLTSYPGLLTSRDVFLNGQVLRVDATGNILTPLTPEVQSSGAVQLPATSYGFVVLPDAGLSACS